MQTITAPKLWPTWIAHRGAGKVAPENTLAALRCGYAHGWRMFEVDVTLTRDLVPVLMHDELLFRTTGQATRICDTNWQDLQQLDAGSWHSPEYAGEPVARLSQVARFCQANTCWINLEIKPATGLATLTGRKVALAAQTLWSTKTPSKSHPPLLLSSFDPTALQAALLSAPEIPRGLLIETLNADWISTVQNLKACALVCEHTLITPELIDQTQRLGIHCLAYTVNDPVRAHQLLQWGVRCIISDAIDVISPKRLN